MVVSEIMLFLLVRLSPVLGGGDCTATDGRKNKVLHVINYIFTLLIIFCLLQMKSHVLLVEKCLTSGIKHIQNLLTILHYDI